MSDLFPTSPHRLTIGDGFRLAIGSFLFAAIVGGTAALIYYLVNLPHTNG